MTENRFEWTPGDLEVTPPPVWEDEEKPVDKDEDEKPPAE